MYSFLIDESPSSNVAWALFSADRELGAAIEAIEAAGTALIHLTDDTNWQSDGVRALHKKLGEFRDGAAREIGNLHARAWELSQVSGS